MAEPVLRNRAFVPVGFDMPFQLRRDGVEGVFNP
jgi:hypothetical protein